MITALREAQGGAERARNIVRWLKIVSRGDDEQLQRVAPALAATMVFLTGGVFTARPREFLEAVPNRRCEKPFDLLKLRALVQDALR